jgi:branched-chain amino acid transport system substrate-binding protein
MAIDDINAKKGVNGYKIELDAVDDAATPAKGTENARRLIVEDKVVALFGAVSSGVCLAESPLAKQNKIPFITFTCNDYNLTTRKYQPYIASVVPNTYMEGRAIANYLAPLYRFTKYYVLAPDYSFGHTEADAFKARLKELNPNAKIIGEDYPKLGATDYTSYINKILAAQPDLVYSNIYSGDLVTFVKQAKPYDFFNKVQFATLTSTNDLQTLGADYPINLLGYARAPFYAINTPENKDKVMGKIVGLPFKGLRGTFTIRTIDHQADVPEWVGTTATTPDYPYPIFKNPTLVSGASLLMPEAEVQKLQASG